MLPQMCFGRLSWNISDGFILPLLDSLRAQMGATAWFRLIAPNHPESKGETNKRQFEWLSRHSPKSERIKGDGNPMHRHTALDENFSAFGTIEIVAKLWEIRGHPRAFQNHWDCLDKKEFLLWNTRTKRYLCANFQDIWSSSKSWKLDIRLGKSARKMQVWNKFSFCKRITILL